MNKLGEQREVGGTPWAARDMSRSGSQLGSSRALALQRACICASDETRLFRHFTVCLTDQRFAITTRRDLSFIGPLLDSGIVGQPFSCIPWDVWQPFSHRQSGAKTGRR